MKQSSKETQLLQLMLFFDTFSAKDLKAAVKANADPIALQTVNNVIQKLLHQEALEVVGTESSGGGRNRRRYRVSINPIRRDALYKEVYGTEYPEHQVPEKPRGDALASAMRMLDEAKVHFAPRAGQAMASPQVASQGRHESLRIVEHLEVAFYEQPLAVRHGPIGQFLREARRDAQEIPDLLQRQQSATTPPILPTSSGVGEMIKELWHAVISRSPVLPKIEMPWIEPFIEAINWSRATTLTSLDMVRYAISGIAMHVQQPSERNILREWYGHYDFGDSFESTYNRTCVDLFTKNWTQAESEWCRIVAATARPHAQPHPVLDRLKARQGMVIGPRSSCRVSRVNSSSEFKEAYTSLRESCVPGYTIEAASMDGHMLALASGGSGIVGLSSSLPTGLSACQQGSWAIPLRENIAPPLTSKLFATQGIAPFLDVPGPAPLKLAVALEAFGIAGEQSLKTALEVYEKEHYIIFTHDAEHNQQTLSCGEALPIQQLSPQALSHSLY